MKALTFTEEDHLRLESSFATKAAELFDLFRKRNRQYDALFFRCDSPAEAFEDIKRKYQRVYTQLSPNSGPFDHLRGPVAQVDTSAVRDNLMDLAAYSIMALIYLEEQEEKQ